MWGEPKHMSYLPMFIKGVFGKAGNRIQIIWLLLLGVSHCAMLPQEVDVQITLSFQTEFYGNKSLWHWQSVSMDNCLPKHFSFLALVIYQELWFHTRQDFKEWQYSNVQMTSICKCQELNDRSLSIWVSDFWKPEFVRVPTLPEYRRALLWLDPFNKLCLLACYFVLSPYPAACATLLNADPLTQFSPVVQPRCFWIPLIKVD